MTHPEFSGDFQGLISEHQAQLESARQAQVGAATREFTARLNLFQDCRAAAALALAKGVRMNVREAIHDEWVEGWRLGVTDLYEDVWVSGASEPLVDGLPREISWMDVRGHDETRLNGIYKLALQNNGGLCVLAYRRSREQPYKPTELIEEKSYPLEFDAFDWPFPDPEKSKPERNKKGSAKAVRKALFKFVVKHGLV